MFMDTLTSGRIRLINCNEAVLTAILRGDDYLAKALSVTVPDQWSVFGIGVFEYILVKIGDIPSDLKWYSYLPIEKATNTLLGSCGYKGGPDETGVVEIGYEVAAAFRNQGYATEITELLIRHAFANPVVKSIQAHTLAEKNASVRVLEKCQFKFVEEIFDEEDGTIWKWNLKR